MPQEPDPQQLQEKVRHIAGMMTQAHVAALVTLGLRLGLYEAMTGAGPLASDELAAKTGLKERWLREWLRGQAAGGVLEYRGDDRFELTPEVSTLLADQESMLYLGGNFLGLPARMAVIEQLEESFRTGLGISWTDRNEEWVAGSEPLFRVWYRQQLVPVGLPMLQGVVERLRDGAKVADVGCGTGIALIEMAKAFPASEYHGYEISQPSIERGRQYADEAGLTNVFFHNADEDPLPADGSFDLISTFDCLHDMTRPEQTAAAIRAAIRPDGVWLIADINSAATFEENLQNAATPLLYALSVLSCMSSGLSEPGGAGLGTVGLPEPKMRELVESAGFTRFRRLDIPHPINAFYEVRV